MSNELVNVIYKGCKALKDKHFFQEAFNELNVLKESESFKKLDEEQQSEIVRLLAECKYQDKELSYKVRFKEAIELLDTIKKEGENVKQEPEWSCLMGAIYKRKYQMNKNYQDLTIAIKYYSDAVENIENDKDDGYGAVNTIFLYKTLIYDFKDTLSIIDKKRYEDKIVSIRNRAMNNLDDNFKDPENKPDWIDATYTELYFGYKDKDKYIEAKEHLKENFVDTSRDELNALLKDSKSKETCEAIEKALSINTTMSRDKLISIEQLIRLYKLQEDTSIEKATKFLEDFFEDYLDKNRVATIVHTVLVGKLGIAFSGGGFRASLFHIGVLARLAELNMLRYVEVISSVSGGSIVAMQYYLMLKKLLESKPNADIKQEHYLDLVQKLEEKFLKAMKVNIRMMAFRDFDMSCESVTQRVGMLYQSEIYNDSYNWTGSFKVVPTQMNELLIEPKSDEHFKPHFNNIEIDNKVPILIINATCLNNGHNWRFTASGMGESQYMYDTIIDKNKIHKYARYEKFEQEKFKNISIANAVAASSGVPVLFDPIELNGAYERGENIKLVDGGMYDNQGLASLIDEECSLIVCSDASGQFDDDEDPSSCRLKVLPRMNDALMDRARDLEYEIVHEMLESKKLNGLCVTHLKQCFQPTEVDKEISIESINDEYSEMEKIIYDKKLFSKDVQKGLSKVRTDLDSFHNMEAYSLSYSGYTVMSKWFEHIKEKQSIWKNFDEVKKGEWKFFEIEKVLREEEKKKTLIAKLEISQKLFFKVKAFQMLSLSLSCVNALYVFLVLILIYIFIHSLLFIIISIVSGFLLLMGVLITYIVLLLFMKKTTLLHEKIKRFTKPILSFIARFNLKYLNDKYLENGKIGE